MSEEQATLVSDTAPDGEYITAQEEDQQQPQESTNEEGKELHTIITHIVQTSCYTGENAAKSEEEAGQTVEEDDDTTVVGEGDHQQTAVDEGGDEEEQAPGEPAVTEEEIVSF